MNDNLGLPQKYLNKRNVPHVRDMLTGVVHHYLESDSPDSWRIEAAIRIMRVAITRLENELKARKKV